MQQRNVLGGELIPCSTDPLTGYYRTGCCENRGDDPGMHVVCCQVTEEFLAFSLDQGNDLMTPIPQYGFPGGVAADAEREAAVGRHPQAAARILDDRSRVGIADHHRALR